jgi:hypothetical protein
MKPYLSWVCGAGLVVVSFAAVVGMPPSEARPSPSATEIALSDVLFPMALVGMAWAVAALVAGLRRRLRAALSFGVACLLTFELAGYAADRISPEGGWANMGAVAVLFLPFVLGLYATYRRTLAHRRAEATSGTGGGGSARWRP